MSQLYKLQNTFAGVCVSQVREEQKKKLCCNMNSVFCSWFRRVTACCLISDPWSSLCVALKWCRCCFCLADYCGDYCLAWPLVSQWAWCGCFMNILPTLFTCGCSSRTCDYWTKLIISSDSGLLLTILLYWHHRKEKNIINSPLSSYKTTYVIKILLGLPLGVNTVEKNHKWLYEYFKEILERQTDL